MTYMQIVHSRSKLYYTCADTCVESKRERHRERNSHGEKRLRHHKSICKNTITTTVRMHCGVGTRKTIIKIRKMHKD